MRFTDALNIVHDLIVGNLHPQRDQALLASRDWTRHLRYAQPDARNAYGYPVQAGQHTAQ